MIFMSIDWAEQEHTVVILDADGATLERARVEQSHDGLAQIETLVRRHAATPADVAVAIELHEGLLVDWLVQQGYRIYGMNPKSAERARDRFSPAGLKDDARDAWGLAEFVRTSYQHLRPLRPESDPTLALRGWVKWREDLMQDRTLQIQRLRSHLAMWNPHFLRAASDLTTRWTLDLLDLAPTAHDFSKLTSSQIDRFVRGRRLRSITADRILVQATLASPTTRSARELAHAAEVRHRTALIRSLDERIQSVERELQKLIDQHPDANIFRSLPVRGPVTTATFLAAFGEDRQRWTSHQEVAARWGAAPVTRESGKRRIVVRRLARDATVHQAWLWFSFNTTRKTSCWARTYYQEKRRTGTDHYTALRALAHRWIKIVFKLWHDRTCYDELFHQARRQQRLQPQTP